MVGAPSRQTWSSLKLSGKPIAHPLAIVFRLEDGGIYLLEKEQGAHIRLLRIERRTGLVTVVAPKLLVGDYDHVALAIGYDGDLLVGASRAAAKRTDLFHLSIRREGAQLVDRFSTKTQAFVGDLRENGREVGFLVPANGGFVPRAAARASFQPAPAGAPINPVFP